MKAAGQPVYAFVGADTKEDLIQISPLFARIVLLPDRFLAFIYLFSRSIGVVANKRSGCHRLAYSRSHRLAQKVNGSDKGTEAKSVALDPVGGTRRYFSFNRPILLSRRRPLAWLKVLMGKHLPECAHVRVAKPILPNETNHFHSVAI